MTHHNINSPRSDIKCTENELPDLLDYRKKRAFARSVFIWIISTVEVPIMLLTLYALCFLIKSHRTTSVFVIHLILSDLVQTICLICLSKTSEMNQRRMLEDAHEYSLIVGLYFMAFVALERCLLVSCPIWHKTHQTLKFCCLISVIVWFVPLTIVNFASHPFFRALPRAILCLIPYPIIILCFVGTWRALSHSISLTSLKRRKILGTLFLVLLSYTFLILPRSITDVFTCVTKNKFRCTLPFVKVNKFVECLLFQNPLADCLLYLFMRSDVADIMPPLRCGCRRDTQHIQYNTQPEQHNQHHNVTAV